MSIQDCTQDYGKKKRMEQNGQSKSEHLLYPSGHEGPDGWMPSGQRLEEISKAEVPEIGTKTKYMLIINHNIKRPK